jgi:rubredoxin
MSEQPMGQWYCPEHGTLDETPNWDEYESRRLCPHCGGVVKRDI